MQINKRSRAELKLYYVRNAIPTESNFAEFIDAMLNQREDGIAKLPNDALSVEAAGDEASQKRAIHFYNSFSDTNPTWAISLNPRQDPANAATARPGFSISDAAGNSRLFVDRATGRLGLGTNDPQRRLHVQGVSSGPFLNDTNDRPAIAITGHYPELGLFSNVNNLNHGPAIRLGSFTDGTATTFKQWVIGTAGRNAAFLDIGFSDKSDANPHAGIRNYNGKTILTFTETGRVGVGTLDPVSDLTLRRDAAHALGPIITLTNASGGAGCGGAIDFNGYNVGANSPTLRIQSLDDGNYSSHLVISTKTSGGSANALVERLRITSAGAVGIGPTWAVPNGKMAQGSLTLGNTNANFGGGSNWNANTAGLLLETSANTEIAVHDSGTRVASLMYYEGDAVNRITIGRDMGWGGISSVLFAGNVGVGTAAAPRYVQANAFRGATGDWAALGTDGTFMVENVHYKALMIVGSNQAQGKNRWVRLWDYLTVHGGAHFDGEVEAASGAVIHSIGIGTQVHGATAYPYETIQMNPGHNLRVCFGTKERFLLANSGEFRIKFDQGYWAFQPDGNLVKYNNSGAAIWALNLVSGKVGWS